MLFYYNVLQRIIYFTLQETVKETGETGSEEAVLEGHLGIAKELLNFLPPEKKYQLGSDEKTGLHLIKVVKIFHKLCLIMQF